jgi:hypothetical protein
MVKGLVQKYSPLRQTISFRPFNQCPVDFLQYYPPIYPQVFQVVPFLHDSHLNPVCISPSLTRAT